MADGTRALALLIVAACAGESDPEPVDPGQPDELALPDLSGVDLVAAYDAALELALALDARVPWDTHVRALDMRSGGCPDLYAGSPGQDSDLPPDAGWGWLDGCLTLEGLGFRGWEWWDASLSRAGEADTAEGILTDAARQLVGAALIADGDEVLFEFRGEASDALSRTDAPGYERWVHSSRIDATITGAWADAGLGIAGGGRVAVYRSATGGDTERLELRGDVFLFETRLAGRFDSVAMDLSFTGPAGAGPDDCVLEPRGWIGLRDEQAFWYDLVFQPRSDEEGIDAACDGCGTLYVRGLEQAGMEVCLDVAPLWEGEVSPPGLEAYAWSMRAVEEAP